MEAVRTEWLRRVEAEYQSAAIGQHLGLWLLQIGASPDLVRASNRVASDEMTHAAMSHRAYVAAGGRAKPRIARESLALPRTEGEPLERDVLRATSGAFCLGETVAVPLFKAMRDGCTAPAARKALDRVLRDEVRHREFGWTLLGWLFDAHGSLRALCSRELPASFAALRASYGGAKDRVTAEERAWGLIAPRDYARIVERTFERDWVPRFRRLGIDARASWR